MSKKPRVLVVDGDVLFYRAAFSGQEKISFGEEDVILTDLEKAVSKFDSLVKDIIGGRGFNQIIVAQSDSLHNFRKDIYPEYKAHRNAFEKPALLEDVKKYAAYKYNVVEKLRIEADDVLGIYATDPNIDAVIWSIDKDLMQIPGSHLVNGNVISVSKEDGELFFFKQVLTGDRVDNYKGCPGIGPKKADKILDGDIGSAWQRIVETYEKVRLTEEDALIQARVARILRHGEYRDKTGKVKLWDPNRK